MKLYAVGKSALHKVARALIHADSFNYSTHQEGYKYLARKRYGLHHMEAKKQEAFSSKLSSLTVH